MQLLPPAPNKCPICAAEHAPDQAHDARSLYYQMRFQATHGRWPTWADAVAHLTPEERRFWEQHVRSLGIVWSSPPEGIAPIADPPAESIHQTVETGGFVAVSM